MRDRLAVLAVSIVTICACAVFASTLVHAALYAPQEEVTVASSSPLRATPTGVRSIPVEIAIPAINVDAHVQDVGIGKTGNMAVPTNYTDVGWYRYGPTPGQVGSAVIDGHIDNGFGQDAVFKHLSDLKTGDDIYVQTASSTLHFVVADTETYASADVPTDLLFNRYDEPRLNLITCAGTWLPDQDAYDSRTVVYAVLAR